ncbi:MAG: hypothetical protein ACMG57_00425 [Candidatus Dojkabacteria bacterium]
MKPYPKKRKEQIMGNNTPKVQRLMVLVIAIMAMMVLSLSAVGAQDSTPTAPTHDVKDTYSPEKVLATGATFEGTFSHGGFTYSVKSGQTNILNMSGNGVVDSGRDVGSPIVAIGGADSLTSIYVATQHDLLTFSDASKGFIPTNINVAIMPDYITLYGASKDCLIGFVDGAAAPQGFQVVQGGDFVYALRAIDCTFTKEVQAQFLMWTAAKNGVWPSDMAVTDYDTVNLLATGSTFSETFSQNNISIKVDTDGKTMLVTGGGYVDGKMPTGSHIVQIGGNGSSAVYTLGQTTFATYSSSSSALVPTNVNLGNLMPDGLTVFGLNADKNLVVFDSSKAQAQLYQVKVGGDHGFTLSPLNTPAQREFQVTFLKWLAGSRKVTPDMMVQN